MATKEELAEVIGEQIIAHATNGTAFHNAIEMNAEQAVRRVADDVLGTYLSRQIKAVAELMTTFHNRERVALQAAFSSVPGLDSQRVAEEIAAAMPEQDASAIVDELVERLSRPDEG